MYCHLPRSFKIIESILCPCIFLAQLRSLLQQLKDIFLEQRSQLAEPSRSGLDLVRLPPNPDLPYLILVHLRLVQNLALLLAKQTIQGFLALYQSLAHILIQFHEKLKRVFIWHYFFIVVVIHSGVCVGGSTDIFLGYFHPNLFHSVLCNCLLRMRSLANGSVYFQLLKTLASY